MAAVLVKLATDRQMALTPSVLWPISCPRIDRSLGYRAGASSTALDAEALAAQAKAGHAPRQAVLARLGRLIRRPSTAR